MYVAIVMHIFVTNKAEDDIISKNVNSYTELNQVLGTVQSALHFTPGKHFILKLDG